jgi:hypothetical protein
MASPSIGVLIDLGVNLMVRKERIGASSPRLDGVVACRSLHGVSDAPYHRHDVRDDEVLMTTRAALEVLLLAMLALPADCKSKCSR